MKLYTKTGDDGTTGLVGGSRVQKDCVRIGAIGAVDELNCVLGVVLCHCNAEELGSVLKTVQPMLFELGADLATPDPSGQQGPIRVGPVQVQQLEQQIDRVCGSLPPMEHFILPGGGALAAQLHLARAVCRRTERLCVALARTDTRTSGAVIFLNRLSDLLFAMGRRANQIEGIDDTPWRSDKS